MNIKFLLFVISAAAISSCSTAYKNTQTPDDVYYSPARVEEDSYVEKEKDKVKADNYFEDRQIRMAVYDRRWRDFDGDYDYRYDPYTYGYTYGYYYNPYYCHYPVYITNVSIVNPKNTTPRMTNLGSYNTNSLSYTNTKLSSYNRISSQRAYNNSNNNNTFIRRIFTSPTNTSVNSTNNSSNNSTESNTRSYTPSTSNSSSSGSSSGGSSGGTSVSRPGRGG